MHYFFLLLLCFISICSESQVPVPEEKQISWQEAELTAVFHYDLHVFDDKKYNQAENRITPVNDYNIFNPAELNTDQWIETIARAGFKIAILTATHETGFALYQSDVNPYCLKAVKWRDGKGDIVRDFVNSCRKYGVRPGIYIGIRWNAFLGVHDFKIKGEDPFSRNRQAYYIKLCEGMVTELCSRYGDLAIVWFDGGASGPSEGGPDVLPIVSQLQPGALFYHNLQKADIRWGGSESGTVPYPCWGTFPYPFSHGKQMNVTGFGLLKSGDPDGSYYVPAMSDAPLRGANGRHEWFWEPGDEKNIFSTSQLTDMYTRSAGHNSTLILGITPDNRGLIPKPDTDTLLLFGEKLKTRFSNPVTGWKKSKNSYTLKVPSGRIIHDIVLKEDIRHGERIRKFTLEARIKNKWVMLKEGSCIGHQFIYSPDKPVSCAEVRLRIIESKGQEYLKEFAVY